MLKIPSLGTSPLCPVQAIKNMLLITPGTKNSPLFQVKNESTQWVPLTDTKVRCNFTQILTRLGLQHSGISLHTFRRSGATLAFNSNVSIPKIQSHGTGGLIVSGDISFKTIMLHSKWLILSRVCSIEPRFSTS